VLLLLVLVPLHDVLERDLLAVDRAHALVLDPPMVLVVQLVELQRLLLGRRVQANGDRHEAEREGCFPHRSRHVNAPPGMTLPSPGAGGTLILPPWSERFGVRRDPCQRPNSVLATRLHHPASRMRAMTDPIDDLEAIDKVVTLVAHETVRFLAELDATQ